MNKQILAVALLCLLVGGGIGYLAPHTLARSGTPNTFARTAGAGNFMRGGMGMTGGAVSGTVATKGAGSLTIDTRDGSSHLILISSTTAVTKSMPGTLDDVVVKSAVLIGGTPNSDGSISATSIQLRPAAPTQN